MTYDTSTRTHTYKCKVLLYSYIRSLVEYVPVCTNVRVYYKGLRIVAMKVGLETMSRTIQKNWDYIIQYKYSTVQYLYLYCTVAVIHEGSEIIKHVLHHLDEPREIFYTTKTNSR